MCLILCQLKVWVSPLGLWSSLESNDRHIICYFIELKQKINTPPASISLAICRWCDICIFNVRNKDVVVVVVVVVWNLLRESANQLSHPRTERTMSVMLYKARSNQSSRKQRCMKTLGECWEFMTDTQVALSERSLTSRPCSLGAHSLIETTTVSSSNSLMAFLGWEWNPETLCENTRRNKPHRNRWDTHQ